jgi:hypothetical protein
MGEVGVGGAIDEVLAIHQFDDGADGLSQPRKRFDRSRHEVVEIKVCFGEGALRLRAKCRGTAFVVIVSRDLVSSQRIWAMSVKPSSENG